jgi:hypothetical protein
MNEIKLYPDNFSEYSLKISCKYNKLHTICERFLIIKWNTVQIIDDFYIILGKFKSILIDIIYILMNINEVLKDFKVMCGIFENNCSTFMEKYLIFLLLNIFQFIIIKF